MMAVRQTYGAGATILEALGGRMPGSYGRELDGSI